MVKPIPARHPAPSTWSQRYVSGLVARPSLTAAYDAYKLSLHGKPAPVVQGMSGDQQFFVSFAQSWRGKFREPALRNRIVTDGHAPNQYRAFTVRNIDAWYQAFNVKRGQDLYLTPADRVRVW